MESPSDKKLHQREATLNILIVEDNEGDIVIIRELLRDSSYPFILTKASTLKESVRILKQSKFDVILLDLGLPDSSGLETLKEFLSYEIKTPVVVMTGLDDEDIALESLRVGAQDYIVKYRLNSENLLRSIKYSIERKKLENFQKKNSRQLSILSDTTASLYGGDDVPSIYSLICRSIRQLVENAFVESIEFETTHLFHISNNEQFQPWAEKIQELTGLPPEEQIFKTSDHKRDIIDLFHDGKLHKAEDSIFGLLDKTVNKNKITELENLIGIRHTYLIGFLRNENYYGGILIFAKDEIDENDIKIIENLCSQASLGIYRRIIKHNLVLSEARYQKLAGDLEEIVRERTIELEKTNIQLRINEKQLKELNATKDKFFNIVAHDLKNPFTSLLGATELLSENIKGMDREKISKLAQILNESAKSGYAILLNLLDWSRSQTGLIRINLQKLNLKKLIDDNIADIHLHSIGKEISIISELKEDINIIADKNMLNTILRNLLSNAVKFTPRKGKVLVKAEINDQEVVISVIDNGIGIAEENVGKLFRIDSKYSRPGTDKEMGTGLGLKLCREFIEKLGGKIQVRSKENKGSEFIFYLPLIKDLPLKQ